MNELVVDVTAVATRYSRRHIIECAVISHNHQCDNCSGFQQRRKFQAEHSSRSDSQMSNKSAPHADPKQAPATDETTAATKIQAQFKG